MRGDGRVCLAEAPSAVRPRDASKASFVNGASPGDARARVVQDRRSSPGLAFIHITIALVNASYNLRMVRNWHEHTGLGDPDHPLLAIDDGPHEWEFIRPDTPEPDAA